jgi:hypothetical protein
MVIGKILEEPDEDEKDIEMKENDIAAIKRQ